MNWLLKRSLFSFILLFAAAIALFFFILSFELTRWKETPQLTVYPNNTYKETLVVAADIDYEPYSFLDEEGRISGYDIELIYIIANKLEKNVEIKLMNWNDARNAVLNGSADLLMGLEYTPETLPEFYLSMPIQCDPFVAFGQKTFSKMSQLYESRIAVLENSGSYSAFLRPHKFRDELSFYSTYSDAFSSVATGENDFIIARYAVGRRMLAKLGEPSLKAVGPRLANNYLCVGAKDTNFQLIGQVNEVLIKLIKDGTLDGLSEKWLGHYVEILSAWDFLYYNAKLLLFVAIGSFLGFISVYIYSSYKLRKASEIERENLARVLEYQQLLNEATQGLYESINEIDLTHDRAGGERTGLYFETLGVKKESSYTEVVMHFATQYLQKEYVQGWLDLFLPQNALEAYKKGINNLQYESLVTTDGGKSYYWVRVTARLFYWKSDNSVRMITYRQNIDEEKKHEMCLLEKAQKDPMTNLYNKRATEELINDVLKDAPFTRQHAFLILDIDHFKTVNDTLGHAFGDFVITEFVAVVKRQFRSTDIIGRIGGDEFVVFIKNISSPEWAYGQAQKLVDNLRTEVVLDSKSCQISASIGLALYPEAGCTFETLYKNADLALYRTKEGGRDGATLYKPQLQDDV